MRAGVSTMAKWREDSGRATDDPFLRAIQGRMEQVRAPQSLRDRIGAMLAVEQAHSDGEPEDDWPR